MNHQSHKSGQRFLHGRYYTKFREKTDSLLKRRLIGMFHHNVLAIYDSKNAQFRKRLIMNSDDVHG